MLWLARASSSPRRSRQTSTGHPDELHRLALGAKLPARSLRHGGEVHAVAFCPEGRRLATGGEDGTARLWDLSTGSALSVIPWGTRDPSAPSRSARTGARRDRGRRWAHPALGCRDGAPVGDRSAAAVPASLHFSPDGSRIAATGGPGGPPLGQRGRGDRSSGPAWRHPRPGDRVRPRRCDPRGRGRRRPRLAPRLHDGKDARKAPSPQVARYGSSRSIRTDEDS